jgi:fucose 4-O-acetylase-like acetyltransferase
MSSDIREAVSVENPTLAPVRAVNRVQTVDIVKGIAILLMVYGHIEQGGMHRHWWDAMPGVVAGVHFSNAFVYSFHMASFFFVAGLFLTSSIHRRGPWPFTLEKCKTILYPYLLWSLVTVVSDPLTARFRSATHPFSWSDAGMGILSGNDSWFLITLFICQILALLVYRLPHWAQMLLALAACYLIPFSSITVFYTPFLYFPFVVAGIWFGAEGMRRLASIPQWQVALGFAALCAAQLFIIAHTGDVSRWNRFPVGMVGIFMLVLFSTAFSGTLLGRVFAWFGEASLAIFLISPFCQGFARELVSRLLHTTAPLPQLGITTLLTPIVPAILWQYQDQLHIRWLFRWPAPRKPARNLKPQDAAA